MSVKISKGGMFSKPLLVDNLSVTIEIESKQEQAFVNKQIRGLQEAGFHAGNASKKLYRNSVLFYAGDVMEDRKLLAQTAPWLPSTPYLRIEYNPANTEPGAIRALVSTILPGGWEQFVQSSVCTRLDLAVDVHGVAIKNLIIHWPGMRKSRQFFSSGSIVESSYLQTYEIGSYSGERHLTVYDRVAKLKQLNKALVLKHQIPGGEVTRFEMRLRPRVKWSSVAQMDNVFAEVSVKEMSAFGVSKDPLFALFLRAVQADGAQNTLLMLPEATRKAFKARLAIASTPWWAPVKIWEGFSSALGNVLAA